MRRTSLLAAAVAAAVLYSASSPASAAMMACTGENMAKSQSMITMMPDSPSKFGMTREMGMANTEMSKGNMRGACMHYMQAQKMGSMGNGMMMGGRM